MTFDPNAQLDPSQLTALIWAISVPTNPATEPCQASFTLRDVAFTSF